MDGEPSQGEVRLTYRIDALGKLVEKLVESVAELRVAAGLAKRDGEDLQRFRAEWREEVSRVRMDMDALRASLKKHGNGYGETGGKLTATQFYALLGTIVTGIIALATALLRSGG